MLGKARILLQIEADFGDAVIPPPVKMACPPLLDLPAPRLCAYQNVNSIRRGDEACFIAVRMPIRILCDHPWSIIERMHCLKEERIAAREKHLSI
jgi:hypothetical protein